MGVEEHEGGIVKLISRGRVTAGGFEAMEESAVRALHADGESRDSFLWGLVVLGVPLAAAVLSVLALGFLLG